MQEVLNRKHVAQLLSCSEGTVDNLVRRGLLKFTRRWPGGPKCFLWEHVHEYLKTLSECSQVVEIKVRRRPSRKLAA